MRRVLVVVFFIGVSCLFLSGCMTSMHGLTHPHSEIEAPTFCLYEGRVSKHDAEPRSIDLILVTRVAKINDERLEWETSQRLEDDQVTWEMEYDPDGKSNPPSKPFSCLTYGKVPPGYIETIPAQPLIPERFYAVLLRRNKGRTPNVWVYFIIRADAQGQPTHLEYKSHYGNVQVITPR